MSVQVHSYQTYTCIYQKSFIINIIHDRKKLELTTTATSAPENLNTHS